MVYLGVYLGLAQQVGGGGWTESALFLVCASVGYQGSRLHRC